MKSNIREFLVKFDRERLQNRRKLDENAEAGDEELLNFDIMSRSSNDLRSLSGRYEILKKRFDRFLKENVKAE
jgi:hypothetical protein